MTKIGVIPKKNNPAAIIAIIPWSYFLSDDRPNEMAAFAIIAIVITCSSRKIARLAESVAF